MKGAEGRRGPLAGLMDKFDLTRVREATQRQQAKQAAADLERSRAHVEPPKRTHSAPRYDLRRATKRPMTKVVAQRRRQSKAARSARRNNR